MNTWLTTPTISSARPSLNPSRVSCNKARSYWGFTARGSASMQTSGYINLLIKDQVVILVPGIINCHRAGILWTRFSKRMTTTHLFSWAKLWLFGSRHVSVSNYFLLFCWADLLNSSHRWEVPPLKGNCIINIPKATPTPFPRSFFLSMSYTHTVCSLRCPLMKRPLSQT